jgi:acyltransferase
LAANATPSPRDARLDVARGIAVLLVLYAHSLEPLFIRDDSTFVRSAFVQWRVIYSFHMPLFFFMSGAARSVSGGTTARPSSLGRVVRDALSLILFVELGQLLGGALGALDQLRQGARDGWLMLKPVLHGALVLCDLRLGIFWYLVSLALVMVLAALWSAKPRVGFRLLVLCVCAVSLVAALPTGTSWDVSTNWFQIRSLLPGLLFYALGRASAGRFPPLWVGSASLVLLVLLAPLNRGCPFDPSATCADVGQEFGPWMILGRHGFLPLFYACAALGCVGILGVAGALPSRVLAYLGQSSLHIYVINAVFLDFFLMKISRVKLVEELSVLGYVGIFAGTVLLHVFALLVARRPIDTARTLCNRWAQRIVDGLLHPFWRRVSAWREDPSEA